MTTFATAQQALGFVTDQTLRINTEVYAIQYPEQDYASLVPVDSTGPEWSRGVTSYISDRVGAARWQSGNAKDVPMADVTRAKVDTYFEMAAIGYEYNLEEINTAALIPGTNLTTMKADAAREAAQTFLYELCMFGDAVKNMPGLTTSAGVTAGLVAQNAGATSRLWTQKTPQEILTDINTLITGIYTGSNTVEMANTLLLPINAMLYIATQTLTATNSETILSFVQRTNSYTVVTGQPLLIRGVRDLETKGAGGVGRMVAYNRNPRVLSFFLPMPHRFLPVWQNGPLNFAIPGIFRTGGLEIRRPAAIRYADGFI